MTGLTRTLLPLKQQRFEVVSVAIASLAIGTAALALAIYLNSISPGASCLAAFWASEGLPATGCADPEPFFTASRELGDKILLLIGVYPAFVGGLIGAGLAAGEIEDGVASWTWPMAARRLRWYALKAVPVLGFTLVIAAALGLSSHVLAQAMTPWLDVGQSFRDYGLHGVLVPLRTLPSLAIGLVLGFVLGRSIRGFLIATVVALVLIASLGAVRPFGQSFEPLPPDSGTGARFDLTVGSRFLTPDGRVLTVDDAIALAPAGSDAEVAFEWARTEYDYVVLGVPGERARDVVIREAAILLVLSTAVFVLSAAILQRRRPY